MNDKADILLARYFSGEASEQELRELDQWLAESAENEKYFDDMTMLYQKTAIPAEPPVFNTNDALNDFKTYIRKEEKLSVKKSYNLTRYISIAASVLLVFGIFSFFLFNKPTEKTIQIASNEQVTEHTLFDNIHVFLSPDSKIEYTDRRETTLKLTGEATFSIEEGREDRLIVQAGETFIKHIGTVFTVSAYEGQDFVRVDVHEGEVVFYSGTDEGIYIREHEYGIYDIRNKKFQHVQMEQVANELIFDAVSLEDIVDILEEYFDTTITLDPQARFLRISVSFDKDESLENILEIIAETLSLTISKNGNNYRLSF